MDHDGHLQLVALRRWWDMAEPALVARARFLVEFKFWSDFLTLAALVGTVT